jgi:hypothetical protein
LCQSRRRINFKKPETLAGRGFVPHFRVEINSSYFLIAKPMETLAIKGLQPLGSENVPESDKREITIKRL